MPIVKRTINSTSTRQFVDRDEMRRIAKREALGLAVGAPVTADGTSIESMSDTATGMQFVVLVVVP